MRKIRGFKLGKRLVKVFRWVSRRRRSTSSYRRLDPPVKYKSTTRARIEKWCGDWDRLKTKAKRLCCIKPNPGYLQLGSHGPIEEKPVVPKGHLAVYVGHKTGDRDGDDEFSRVLVPVMYFNHPLFGELLREAEEEYGYQHPGGITIPCRFSEFEKVQTTIAAGKTGRSLLTWRRHL